MLTGFLDLDEGTSVHICTKRKGRKAKGMVSSSVACTRMSGRAGTDLLDILENLDKTGRKRGTGQYERQAATGTGSRVCRPRVMRDDGRSRQGGGGDGEVDVAQTHSPMPAGSDSADPLMD